MKKPFLLLPALALLLTLSGALCCHAAETQQNSAQTAQESWKAEEEVRRQGCDIIDRRLREEIMGSGVRLIEIVNEPEWEE